MAKTKSPKLPDKPSQLIRVALRDLEKCERSKKYKIDMDMWYSPNGVCKVCLAGAVLAQTLKFKSSEHLSLYGNDCGLSDDTRNKMSAIDGFRCGGIQYGLSEIGRKCGPRLPNTMAVEDYHFNKAAFKRDMRKMAAMLAKEGL